MADGTLRHPRPQLKKWPRHAKIEDDKGRWIRFFKEGKDLDPANLPPWMNTPVMREVMSIVEAFSEKEEDYHLYLSRLDERRLEKTRTLELERALAEKDRALAREARERVEKERLQSLLKKAGIDPDQG